MNISVAFAEDNPFLATSIREKLELFPDEIALAFHAVNGKDLLDKLSENPAVDVLLMDIEMPEMDGIEATARVRERFPRVKVLMLTVFDDEQKIFSAIKNGAMGYLLKDESAEKLRASIRMIMKGGAPMSSTIAAKTLALLRNPPVYKKESAEQSFELTPREIDVLQQLSRGLDYKQIADHLFISPATVRKHIENIYRKLHVNNKTRAINQALRHGLL